MREELVFYYLKYMWRKIWILNDKVIKDNGDKWLIRRKVRVWWLHLQLLQWE